MAQKILELCSLRDIKSQRNVFLVPHNWHRGKNLMFDRTHVTMIIPLSSHIIPYDPMISHYYPIYSQTISHDGDRLEWETSMASMWSGVKVTAEVPLFPSSWCWMNGYTPRIHRVWGYQWMDINGFLAFSLISIMTSWISSDADASRSRGWNSVEWQ